MMKVGRFLPLWVVVVAVADCVWKEEGEEKWEDDADRRIVHRSFFSHDIRSMNNG